MTGWPRQKFDRRIYLITDAGCAIKDEEDVPIIVNRMKELETKLNVMYARTHFPRSACDDTDWQ